VAGSDSEGSCNRAEWPLSRRKIFSVAKTYILHQTASRQKQQGRLPLEVHSLKVHRVWITSRLGSVDRELVAAVGHFPEY
jgi:hypothetical protein